MPEFWLQKPRKASAAEEACAEMLRLNGFSGWIREYRFHPKRKWAFDFAFVDERLALEVEGLTGGAGGRHQRVAGFIADCSKYEEAMLLGWTVYRIPSSWIIKGGRRVWRPEMIEAIREMLRRGAKGGYDAGSREGVGSTAPGRSHHGGDHEQPRQRFDRSTIPSQG